jgi:hypothetical protein
MIKLLIWDKSAKNESSATRRDLTQNSEVLMYALRLSEPLAFA